MRDRHQAELERLRNVHKGEMDEVLKQAFDARDARNADKERLDTEIVDVRCTMADNDATLIRTISRLHSQLRGELLFPLEVAVFRLVRPGLEILFWSFVVSRLVEPGS